MAIELVPQLQTGAPSAGSADWDKMIGLVSANEVPDLSFLTGWELTSGIPAVKQGVYIYHAGATYRVNNNDEVISGTPVSGLNYIEVTVSSGVMTLAWVTSLSGYSYNAAYAGIYNAGDVNQILNDVLYIDGVNNYRGRSMGMDFGSFYIAGGAVFYVGGLNTLGNDVNTGGGNINLDDGTLDLGDGGNIENLRSGGFDLDGSLTSGSLTVLNGTTVLVPKGVYMFSRWDFVSNFFLQIYSEGAWRNASTTDQGGCIISDGVNVRFNNFSGTGRTLFYIKY